MSSMDYDQIRQMDTSVTEEYMKDALRLEVSGMHESCLRAYQILGKVKDLLEAGTPSTIIGELIRMMESPLPKEEK